MLSKGKKEHTNVLRTHSHAKNTLVRAVDNLKHSFSDVGYANTLYQKILFLEFMIHLNRATLNEQLEFIDTDHCNTKVVELLQYINRNLTTDLNIDDLAARFYVSKYYMMRLFKAETGYTIGKLHQLQTITARQRTDCLRRANHSGVLRLRI